MKLPNKVNVGGVIYSISEYDEPSDKYGKCEYIESTIGLLRNQSLDNKRLTLLHEIMHAIYHNRLDATHTMTEEQAVDQLSAGIYEVMMNNPRILKYVFSR